MSPLSCVIKLNAVVVLPSLDPRCPCLSLTESSGVSTRFPNLTKSKLYWCHMESMVSSGSCSVASSSSFYWEEEMDACHSCQAERGQKGQKIVSRNTGDEGTFPSRWMFVMLGSLDSKPKFFGVLKLKNWLLSVVHCRKLRDEVNIKKTEKQKLMNIRAKYQNEKHAQEDSRSTLFPKIVIDIPCLTVPQLQVICQLLHLISRVKP